MVGALNDGVARGGVERGRRPSGGEVVARIVQEVYLCFIYNLYNISRLKFFLISMRMYFRNVSTGAQRAEYCVNIPSTPPVRN